MKIIYLFIISLLWNAGLFAQKQANADTLLGKKVKCNCEIPGSKIEIIEFKFDVAVKDIIDKHRFCGYNYFQLYSAKKELKMRLLEQLLSFENDTSVVCMKVHAYWKGLVDSIDQIRQTNYPVNVDALYHINFIFFGFYAGYYAPFPVLYDTVTNEEINNDINKVKEVYRYYKEWHEQCKKNNFKNYSFPLLNTRYRWRFGHTKEVKMEELPILRGEVLKTTGRPKNRLE